MEDSKEVKQFAYTGTEVVTQHNSLLESPKSLTQQEFKLFSLLISKINSETDTDFLVFRVTVTEFAHALGLEEIDYNEFRKVASKLLKRTIYIRRPKAIHDTEIPLLRRADYRSGEGYADLRLNDELKPYLLQLKEQFTQYKLSHILDMSSTYAIHLYELMKQYERLGTYTVTIDEFKKAMGISNFKYQLVHIKKNVLEIAKREINAKSDLTIDYSFEKTGRKFTAIKFTIRSKNPEKALQKQMFYYSSAEKNPHNVKALQSFGYEFHEAIELLQGKDNFEAEAAILSVKEQIKNGKARNPKAMIKTALEKGWQPVSESEETKKSTKTKKKTIEKIESEVEQETPIKAEEEKSGFASFGSFLSKILGKK